MDEPFAYRLRDDCAGIEQEFGTCQARKVFLSERVAAVAVGTGSDPQQSAIVFICLPRQQRRVFRQQLTQSIDVIVMNDAAGFGYGPLKSAAEAFFYFSNQVFPARK